MRPFVHILIVALSALIVFMLGHYFAFERGFFWNREKLGIWTRLVGYGSPEADPVLRALNAVHGDLVLGAAEGLEWFTHTDQQGGLLERRCNYTLSGRDMPASMWTLTLLDDNAEPIENPLNRFGFHAYEVIRKGDGRFEITIAPTAQPGNWLPISGKGKFQLHFRLYGINQADAEALKADDLPRIIHVECVP